MSLNDTPSGDRLHIGFFGMRNAGKSSLLNKVIGQELAVVSDTAGTTTDPVKKAMELLPLGPVLVIDTPGFDDEGTLGEKRVEKTREILRKCDVAVLVVDATKGVSAFDDELIELFNERSIPYVIAVNKGDLQKDAAISQSAPSLVVSALTGQGIHDLKELIGKVAKDTKRPKPLIGDLIVPGDTVILVVPIDSSAPKGRIILPQQMVLRDILDNHGQAVVCQPNELMHIYRLLTEPPALVVTDSQVFGQVSQLLPPHQPLTSFSILMARYKGDLSQLIAGARILETLTDESNVLISEGCTHHRQCEDIGTVKIPQWIQEFSGARPHFIFTSGGEFPEDISSFDLIIHCGACMLNEKEMQYRMKQAAHENVPMVNYGIAIAHMHGILERSLEPIFS